MVNKKVSKFKKDLIVAGGGLAGVCASIAAARHGASVALVQDRPVLGGNSSSEIRVWTCGATAMGHNRFADESGIIGELELENLYRNKEGNPYFWDALLLDYVRQEKNIALFLNTYIYEAETEDGRIQCLHAVQSGSQKRMVFEAPLYVDCTGDGEVGFLAGAGYMQGRESRDAYGESLARETQDKCTLGDSLLYYVKNVGREVKYIPPSFAYSRKKIKEILESTGKYIDVSMHGSDLWWLEYGGMLDTLEDHGAITEELQRLIYGIWDYIKNSGEFDASSLTVEWVGSVPGKRESRRLKGPWVLNQNDLMEQREFEDAVCHGGWPVDTHPEKGIYTKREACTQTPVGPYGIPLRCLYSDNIRNLFFAGRNISASHIAFASSRVMKTCAVMGQAAGTAAAYSAASGRLPREFSREDIGKIRQTLLKDDCWVIGLKNEDCMDKARNATVRASGYKKFESVLSNGRVVLSSDMFIIFPYIDIMDKFYLMMDCSTETVLKWDVYESGKPQNHKPHKLLKSLAAGIKPAKKQWVEMELDICPEEMRNVVIKLNADENIAIYLSEDNCYGMFGVLSSIDSLNILHPCFKLLPNKELYRPENIINRYNRPYGVPNLWMSDCMCNSPAWVELEFDAETEISEVHLYFNPDFNRTYNNLRPNYYKNGWDEMPHGLVKKFSLSAVDGSGQNLKIAEIVDNRVRHVICRTERIKVTKLRLNIEETYGSLYGQVFEIRVY